jgi:hypothetical protein
VCTCADIDDAVALTAPFHLAAAHERHGRLRQAPARRHAQHLRAARDGTWRHMAFTPSTCPHSAVCQPSCMPTVGKCPAPACSMPADSHAGSAQLSIWLPCMTCIAMP